MAQKLSKRSYFAQGVQRRVGRSVGYARDGMGKIKPVKPESFRLSRGSSSTSARPYTKIGVGRPKNSIFETNDFQRHTFDDFLEAQMMRVMKSTAEILERARVRRGAESIVAARLSCSKAALFEGGHDGGELELKEVRR